METTRNNSTRPGYGTRTNGAAGARPSSFGASPTEINERIENPAVPVTNRSENAERDSEDASLRRNPPAHEFQHGRVVTRIWAHPTHWGAVCWQVDQLRRTEPTAQRAFTRSMEQQDLIPSRRGMHAAEQWITKIERRFTRRSRGWGW